MDPYVMVAENPWILTRLSRFRRSFSVNAGAMEGRPLPGTSGAGGSRGKTRRGNTGAEPPF
jgi:hypothetical protein